MSSNGQEIVSVNGGGPATERGKAVSKLNATRHGLLSENPVVSGVETREDWEDHRAGVMESISPAGHLESTLAERVALLSWRLARVTRYETECISLAQEKVEDDLASKRLFGTKTLGASDPAVVRGNLKAARADHRLLKRLPDLKDDKPLSALDADSILWSVAEQVLDEDTAPEDFLETLSIPGAPEYSEWEGYEGWTAGVVRAGVEAIAKITGDEARWLLSRATDAASREVARQKEAADQVEEGLSRLSRERILPDNKELEKIARYEAHLSRQLYQALHELEALQKRRLTGEDTPLARLEVNGNHNEV